MKNNQPTGTNKILQKNSELEASLPLLVTNQEGHQYEQSTIEYRYLTYDSDGHPVFNFYDEPAGVNTIGQVNVP